MSIKKINQTILDNVTKEAISAPRKRKNYNFHDSFDDTINRMLNAVEPGSYVQPHKHENPDKREVFLVLQGRIAVVFFDTNGQVTEVEILDASEGRYGVEIPPSVWHSIISLKSGTVVYEIKDGPYSPMDDKNFAEWAPKEGDEGCEQWLNDLCDRFNLS